MASPFQVIPPFDATRKIRKGIDIVEYRNEQNKVLPVAGEKNILITSALPYVNNQPHLGNIIGSTLSADVFARYSRVRNNRVLYICGTDEYGTTTEVMAAKENVGPQELCDKYHKLHAEAYEWFEIGFDYFGRTTTEKQTEICQSIFSKLHANGWLEEQNKEQLYCEKDQRFLADRYVEGTCPICGADGARGDQCEICSTTYDSLELVNPRCSTCSTTPIARFSSHFFLKLKDLQPQIDAWVDKASAGGIWSANGRAFTSGWLRGGLENRCMTRDLVWGVKLPESLGEKWEKKVMYVWFDAPIGYPSITANYTDDWKMWWQNPENVTLHQFMGKDNVPFHTILFPAYLMGTNDPWTMLHSISTTEYLQYEGTKFSKSKNIGVFGQNARETGVPASVWRYYLLSNRPETSDSEFTWNEFVSKANADLLNNLGNLVNRMIKFVNAKFDSIVPEPTPFDGTLDYKFTGTIDTEFVNDINTFLTTFISQMDQQKIRAAIGTLMTISSRGNQYIQDNRVDNALLVNEPQRCAEVVLITLNLIYLLSALLHPIMPSTSTSIIHQLNAIPRTIPDSFSIDLLPGHTIGKAVHLFSKIDLANVEIWRTAYGGDSPKGGEVVVEELSKKELKKRAMIAQKAKLALEGSMIKSPEWIELEQEILSLGGRIREMKAGGSASADEIKEEVSKLGESKGRLEVIKKAFNEAA